jgi:pyruvate/2-oxoglutarate dehydrogenase complex dihydrolipoamide dehydrogenase (E3) component
VDLVNADAHLLPNDEPEAGELIRQRFEYEGLRLHFGFTAVQAGCGRLTVRGPSDTRELPYDALLLGTGRKANVHGLGLEAAGVRFDKDRIELDEYLRTTNPNIYVAGDVAFPEQFTHAATATARLCIANALDGANRQTRELVIPHCTYTDPEVAQVGLTPRRAREEGVSVNAHRLDLAKVERAFIDCEEYGFAEIYTRSGSDEIGGGDPRRGSCR